MVSLPCNQARDTDGFGFWDTQLNENTWSVVFASNQNTPIQQTLDFVVLHATELSIQHGFKYFTATWVIDRDSGAILTSREFEVSGRIGNDTIATTTASSTHVRVEHTIVMTIVGYAQAPAAITPMRDVQQSFGHQGLFDAGLIVKSVAADYGLVLNDKNWFVYPSPVNPYK